MRSYRPRYIDHYQSATYRHVRTTVDDAGRLWAYFADGTKRPSIYRTEAEMLRAGEADPLERMVRVK